MKHSERVYVDFLTVLSKILPWPVGFAVSEGRLVASLGFKLRSSRQETLLFGAVAYVFSHA